MPSVDASSRTAVRLSPSKSSKVPRIFSGFSASSRLRSFLIQPDNDKPSSIARCRASLQRELSSLIVTFTIALLSDCSGISMDGTNAVNLRGKNGVVSFQRRSAGRGGRRFSGLREYRAVNEINHFADGITKSRVVVTHLIQITARVVLFPELFGQVLAGR